ncbi:hypothetical protein ACTFJJ_24185, partial [Enterobacter roggenkampii]|uniref:hypothetical protein n=1 Tax=Enterobacter roggenkampii TaxID=1812935 RepID=UPI003F75F653
GAGHPASLPAGSGAFSTGLVTDDTAVFLFTGPSPGLFVLVFFGHSAHFSSFTPFFFRSP